MAYNSPYTQRRESKRAMYDEGLQGTRDKMADFLDAHRRGTIKRGNEMEEEQRKADTRASWNMADPAMYGAMLGSLFGPAGSMQGAGVGAAIGGGLGLLRGITSGKKPTAGDFFAGLVPSPLAGGKAVESMAMMKAGERSRGGGGTSAPNPRAPATSRQTGGHGIVTETPAPSLGAVTNTSAMPLKASPSAPSGPSFVGPPDPGLAGPPDPGGFTGPPDMRGEYHELVRRAGAGDWLSPSEHAELDRLHMLFGD